MKIYNMYHKQFEIIPLGELSNNNILLFNSEKEFLKRDKVRLSYWPASQALQIYLDRVEDEVQVNIKNYSRAIIFDCAAMTTKDILEKALDMLELGQFEVISNRPPIINRPETL